MSCRTIPRDELVRTMPVRSPTVKRKMKPRAESIAGDHLMFPSCRVASQLKTLTLVGVAIIW